MGNNIINEEVLLNREKTLVVRKDSTVCLVGDIA